MADDNGIIDPELEALQREAFTIGDGAPDEGGEPAEGEEPDEREPGEPSDAEKLLRLSADFANFRRRVDRERGEQELRGVERAVLSILPVLDHLELALAHAAEGSVDRSFLDGVVMIRDQFLKSLAELGIERIEADGQPFDPNQHEAVAIVPSPGSAEGTVVGVIRPGYRSGGRLLRPARVTVSAPPSQE